MKKKYALGTLLAVGTGAMAIYTVKKIREKKKNEDRFDIINYPVIAKRKQLSVDKYRKYLSKKLSKIVNISNKYQKLIPLLIEYIMIDYRKEELFNSRIKDILKINIKDDKTLTVCKKFSDEILVVEKFVSNLESKIKKVNKDIIKAYAEEDVDFLLEIIKICESIVETSEEGFKLIDSIKDENDTLTFTFNDKGEEDDDEEDSDDKEDEGKEKIDSN